MNGDTFDELAAMQLVGKCAAFRRTMQQVRLLARSTAPVLITGESGTGKELAARAIHYLGARAARPFVPVNCGAVPDALFESELFGYEQGALRAFRVMRWPGRAPPVSTFRQGALVAEVARAGFTIIDRPDVRRGIHHRLHRRRKASL